jgi:hypothetical protein
MGRIKIRRTLANQFQANIHTHASDADDMLLLLLLLLLLLRAAAAAAAASYCCCVSETWGGVRGPAKLVSMKIHYSFMVQKMVTHWGWSRATAATGTHVNIKKCCITVECSQCTAHTLRNRNAVVKLGFFEQWNYR